MPVAGVIDDQPWRRDDPQPLKHSMDEWKVRPAELVGQKAVNIERVREDDPVGFTVIEAERRPGVWGVVALAGIVDRVVAAGSRTLLATAAWMS